jgi:hypothetical protein
MKGNSGSRGPRTTVARYNSVACIRNYFCSIPFFALTLAAPFCSGALTPSGSIGINSQSGRIIENVHITSSTGPCVTIANSTGIIIRNSEIGPCKGGGIEIAGGSGIRIFDNYIHPEFDGKGCCDSGDGIVASGTTDILIQGNVVAYGESNIEILGSRTVNVIGNFLVNPRNFGDSRGSNVQVLSGSSSVLIENNYALASTDTSIYALPENQSDSISVSGTVNEITVRNNYITGGNWAYGCGLIAEAGASNAQFLSNTLVDSGQCGIGLEGGTNVVADGNRILNRTPLPGGGNTAIIVFKLYPTDPPCGPVTITNNTAYQIQLSGFLSSLWNGGGCAPVTTSGNTVDQAAYAALTPPSEKIPPPRIPPQPSTCVANSPFSNQTGAPGCDGRFPVSATTLSLAAPVSDGFNGNSLDSNLWTFINPAGDGSYAFTGIGLNLSVPAGSNHDPAFGGTNSAVRVIQAVGSSDFTLEAKFDTIPNREYQFEGIVVEQDAANYLRFHIGSTDSLLVVGATRVVSRNETNELESIIKIPDGARSIWLRIQKFGVTWTETWSPDGSTYNTVGSFTQLLTPAAVGPFGGNYSEPASAAPGFTVSIDHFFNIASPAAE